MQINLCNPGEYGTIAFTMAVNASSPPHTLRSAPERSVLRLGASRVCLCLLLAAIAFFLLPSASANQGCLVAVNGNLFAVPAGATVEMVTGEPLSSAKPGSTLDLTGDVALVGQGLPAKVKVNGSPASLTQPIFDGSQVTVEHGSYVLEDLVQKTETIPFKTIVKGSGAVVSLVKSGSPGTRLLYLGANSHTQAAALTTAAAQDTVIERTTSAKKGQKLVALTFDDGPSTWTPGVLAALAAKHVPATFFVLGSQAAAHKTLIAQIKAAGHEVENHTWSHADLTTLSAEAVRNEITRTAEVIGGSRFVRPPYGAYNNTVAAVAGSLGCRLALWTVDTLDWKNRNADAILAHVKTETKPGAIILMHDGGGNREQTIAAIPRVVDWLLQNGYALTLLQNLY